ncbi:hypothetical protein [Cellulomonas hominis]|uniref:hypothetical protein n=1 Tax=Cellulomonas hominis TaxID=156981 RepID=UPI001443C360|nr:hypothetical protein [Cellulomonas hominis]NKY09921.1 hypothetical protein [Cellulomonas hominis]
MTQLKTLLRGAALVACVAQVLVGFVWWVLQLGAVPAYGDTPEYVEIAASLEVDGFRTLAYPLLVKGALAIQDAVGWLPWQVPLYLVQTAVLVAAATYLVRSVAPWASRSVAMLGAAVLATGPLQLHYATSVLSDSLAASAFVVALAAAARLVLGDRHRSTTVLALVGACAAALLRTEKAVVVVAVAAVFAVVALVLARPLQAGVRRAAPLVVALVLPALVASGVNHVTQTADLGRPEAGAAAVAVSRVVWPHLEQIHDDLPAAVRAAVSVEDARAFDDHNNNALPMTERLRDLDDGGDRYAFAAARSALACCGGTVLLDTLGDLAEYTAVPLVLAREAVPVLGVAEPADTPTAWNITRMREAHPSATTVFLVASFVALGLLLLAAAARFVSAWRRGAADLRVAALVLLGTVVNGAAFALAQGADANVRYGLPNAMAFTALLVAAALLPEATRGAHGRG